MTISIKDASNAEVSVKTTEESGAHIPHHIVDRIVDSVAVTLPDGNIPVEVSNASLNVVLENNPVLGVDITMGPWSTLHATSAAGTNATLVKSSQGVLFGGYIRNRALSERYVKIFDSASIPNLAVAIPKITLGIPAGSFLPLASVFGSHGLRLNSGIAFAIVGSFPDLSAVSVSASDVDVNLIYV